MKDKKPKVIQISDYLNEKKQPFINRLFEDMNLLYDKFHKPQSKVVPMCTDTDQEDTHIDAAEIKRCKAVKEELTGIFADIDLEIAQGVRRNRNEPPIDAVEIKRCKEVKKELTDIFADIDLEIARGVRRNRKEQDDS